MTNIKQTDPILVNNFQHYSSQINFIKTIVEKEVESVSLKDLYYKELEKIDKIVKTIKKQANSQKLSNLQLTEIYGSIFSYIQSKFRQILYVFRLQKTDFQFYLLLKQFRKNPNTCGITLNIDIQRLDDRMLKDINLTEIVDIQYHRFSLKAQIMKSTQILKGFKFHNVLMEKDKQFDFLLHKIAQNYNIVSYHNFTHAFSVFAMFYHFASTKNVRKHLNDFELYFCLLACLMHDLRHKGYNSIFEAKIKSQMAMDFGNITILQKMHKSVAFQIIQSLGQYSPYISLNVQQKKYAKKIISNCIIATDMSKHYDYVSKLRQVKIDQNKQQDKFLLMQSMIHACDIGNSLLDYDNYITWANLVCVQFHEQTQKQSLLGIELTNHMRFESLGYFYKNQNTFINTIVLPIWECLDQKINQNKIKERLGNIRQNSKKIGDNLRRNSQCLPKNKLSKQIANLIHSLKLQAK